MLDLSIIIVSYNTRELLKECLLSIKNSLSKTIDYELIVVDNASTDGSPDLLREECKDIGVLENKKNLGFSKANNQGVKRAKGRYLLFLNPDTVVYEGVLEALVVFMESKEDAGAATCRVELPNGMLDDASHRGFPTPWNAFCYFSGLSKLFPQSRLFSGYNLGWMDRKRIHEIDACAGAFMFVRREAGEDVGWWDEDFFWYGEDLDFCYRLKQKNWKIYFIPIVKILHYKGVSGGIKEISIHLTTADEKTRKVATKARFEATKLFYRKHYMEKYPPFVTWVVFLGIHLRRWLALRNL